MIRRPVIRILIAALVLYATGVVAAAGEQKLTCPLGRDYSVYTPEKIDPDRTYWLVVGVHGYKGNGKGAGGIANWTSKGNCIVVGPTFPSEGYQYLHKDSDKQLLGVFKELHDKYTLHKKMFLHGYSGGSQFASRFVMKYPQYVIGCGAHSGGTWPTGKQWGGVDKAAVRVPIAMSCGTKDNSKSFAPAPYSRLDWAKKFAEILKQGGFFYKERYWPGVGHGGNRSAKPLSEECYWLSITGMYPAQRKKTMEHIELTAKLIAAGRRSQAEPRIQALGKMKFPDPAKLTAKTAADRKENRDGWFESPSGNAALAKVREAFLAEYAAYLTAKLEKGK